MHALDYPLTLVELFGGVGTGLAACMKVGKTVGRRIYVENDLVVRQIAFHHARQLHAKWPELLPLAVIEETMRAKVHDIRRISPRTVRQWGKVGLLVAGWECQGLSRAGAGRGLEDERSNLFWELIRILRFIQAE